MHACMLAWMGGFNDNALIVANMIVLLEVMMDHGEDELGDAYDNGSW